MRARPWLRNPVRIQYWLSYCLIALIIAGLLMGLLYARTLGMLETQNRQTAQNMLHSQRLLFERCLQEMEQIALQVDGDPNMAKARLSRPGYDTYSAMLQLQRYVAANLLFREVALVAPEGDVLSSLGSYPLHSFVDKYKAQELYAYLERMAVNPPQQATLLPLTENRHLVVIYPLPSFGRNKSRALLFVMAKEQVDALFSSSMQGERSDFGLYDPVDGRWLYRYQTRTAPLSPEEASWSVASERLPLNYVYDLDDAQIVQSFRLLNRRFALILLFTLPMVLLLAWILAWVSYRPIRRLLALVGGQHGAGGNELGYVMDRMDSVLRANLEMARKLTNYASIAREYVLQRLLCGRSEGEQWPQLLAAAQIILPYPNYTLLYFEPPAYQGEAGGRSPAQLRAEMLRLLIDGANAFGAAYGIEWMNASLVLLINHADPALDVQALYGRLQAAFDARFHSRLQGGGGICVQRHSEIQFSLYRAMMAADYARFSGHAFAVDAQIQPVRLHGQRVRMPLEDALVQSIRHGDPAQTQAQINALIRALSSQPLSASMLRAQTISLISTLFQSVQSMHLDEYYLQILSLLEQPTLEAYAQTLLAFCQRLCENVRDAMAAQGDALLARILGYLEAHYMQADLSVRQVAEALSISPSYLAAYMRERTQTTPAKYIESLRMEQARNLLQRTQDPVREIVRQVGYRDDSSFVRKFREKEGLTPNQYRALYQGKGAGPESRAQGLGFFQKG